MYLYVSGTFFVIFALIVKFLEQMYQKRFGFQKSPANNVS